jgi:hypothetical protein
MPELQNGRTAGAWNNTTYQMHLDASRDLLKSGGYAMDAMTHALVALVLLQKEAMERG